MVSCTRSRREPLGLSLLHPAAQEKIDRPNTEIEVCCWLMEQALTCPACFVHALMVNPEDLGGDSKVGPSSIWELGEVGALDDVNDAQRGAAFARTLTEADQRQPLGLLTNLNSFLFCCLFLGHLFTPWFWSFLRVPCFGCGTATAVAGLNFMVWFELRLLDRCSGPWLCFFAEGVFTALWKYEMPPDGSAVEGTSFVGWFTRPADWCVRRLGEHQSSFYNFLSPGRVIF